MQKFIKLNQNEAILSNNKYGNSVLYEQDQRSQKRRTRRLQWFFVFALLMGYVVATMAQTGGNIENTFNAKSDFDPTIKDAVKLSDLPEIKDTVKRIENIKYGITSAPVQNKYEVNPIDAAKMQNEPLSKLYRSLIKIGMGTYTTPYGEAWLNSIRTRDMAYGFHFKHLSSDSHLKEVGYSGYADDEAELFGKKFYKKHTLTGEFDYKRNMVHYYGYDPVLNDVSKNYTKQYYQLFAPTVRLQSHYTDSTHLNHDIKLGYYNLTDNYNTAENNVRLNTTFNTFVNKEQLFVKFDADYYNHKLQKDTLNNLILNVYPYFLIHGKKWRADVGINATMDYFSNNPNSRFYFYPQLNAQYDIYQNIIVPYAGITGGLQKNSLRSLSGQNPFIDPSISYRNTNNKLNVFGGLKGNLSSTTSYDVKAAYIMYDSLNYFVVNYTKNATLDNTYKVLYDNTNLFTVGGQLKYQYKEKLHFIVKGNYYLYKPKNLTRPYHRPDYDLTFSSIYNLKSKIILRADIFAIGKQFALTKTTDVDAHGNYIMAPQQLKGIVDMNLGAEYRYSKMLSLFVSFNNIGNFRYYRWERYPSQRFMLMGGLTFVPF